MRPLILCAPVRRFAGVLSLLASATIPVLSQVPSYVISTVAGTYSSGDGGPATDALLWFPQAMARDSAGKIYFADFSNGRVRAIALDGTISTIFRASVSDIAIDRNGNVVVATGASVLRVVSPTQTIRIAGNGNFGSSGDGGQAASAMVVPAGIAFDKDGSLFIADQNSSRVRKVTPDGVIRTIAGDGTAGYTGDGGPASAARLNRPLRVAIDDDGNLFIGENVFGGRIRKVDTAGIITTVVGNGLCCSPEVNQLATQTSAGLPNALEVRSRQLYWTEGFTGSVFRLENTVRRVAGTGTPGFAGDGGPAVSARLSGAFGLAFAADGTFWVADSGNHRVRAVSPDGIIQTIAGRTHFEGDGGPALRALLFGPQGAVADARGNVYIADTSNNRIRRVTPDGAISTIAGTGEPGFSGDNGRATSAQLNFPRRVILDPDGNLLVVDNIRVRKITTDGVISTIAGNGQFGTNGDNGPATNAQLGTITGIAVDRNKNIYLVDTGNHRVRVIRADGTIQLFAGTAQGFAGDGGLATAARFSFPQDVAVDAQGNVFVSDNGNFRIRRIAANGTVSSFVGNGQFGFPADGQQAASQPFASNGGIAVDASGNLFVVNSSFARIYMVTPSGVITTIAGGAQTPDTPAERVVATTTGLSGPQGLFADSAGDIYTTEIFYHRVRKLVRNTAARLEIAGGDNQSGFPNRSLADALRVRILGRAGVGVADIPVTFAVTQGTARLSSASTTTGPDGIAGVGLTLGTTAGPVTITASAAGLTTVTFRAVVVQPAVTAAPALRAIEVGEGTAGEQSVRAISPNALIALSGDGFAPGSVTAAPADYVDGKPPVQLGNTCVSIGSTRAFLISVSPVRITAIVPAVGAGDTDITVIGNCTDGTQFRSNSIPVTAAAASPDWVYYARAPEGNHVAATGENGRLIGPAGLVSGREFAPASPGQAVTVSGIGFGATDPPVNPGEAATGPASLASKVQLTIGDIEVPAESIRYVGAAPGRVGGYQLTFVIPAELGEGNHRLVLRIGDAQTPDGAVIAVQP